MAMGRKKLYPVRITLPLEAEVLARVDAATRGGETRLDVIRSAISNELDRREKSSSD
jgi:metal-responsive CopG/Arc/MetJ family transcriptional regulator